MATAFRVYATNTGNWGPDESYGSFGEWQDNCGRPMYRTELAAELAVERLTEEIGEGWPEGIAYGWDQVEVDELPADLSADAELPLCAECASGEHDACSGIVSDRRGSWHNRLCQCPYHHSQAR